MIVFSQEWFEQHQKRLLWFANSKVGKYVLRIHGDRSGVCKNKITKITPNSISWLDNNHVTTEFRTHAKYSKRIYHAFKPLWWLIHFWDMNIANNLNVALNLGFDTLTVYSGPDVGTLDAIVWRESTASTWDSIRTSAGNYASAGSTTDYLWYLGSSATANRWDIMVRSEFVFNTSSIYAGSEIQSSTLTVHYSNRNNGLSLATNESETVLVTSNPVGISSTTPSDYNIANFGTTALADRKSYNSWTPGGNSFTLNASGLGAIEPEGYTKLGFRSGADFDNDEPTYSASKYGFVQVYFGNYTGSSRDPYLTVTYTPPIKAYYSSSNPYASGKLIRDTGSGYADVATSDLRFIVYSEDGDTTVPQLSVDPSNIVKEALDYASENGSNITYTDESIQYTGTTVSYTFVSQTLLEVLNKCVELAPAGWYWYINPATNVLYFKEKNSIQDHTIILGKDIANMSVEKKSDDIVNTVFFTGGDTGGGVILYKKYTDANSLSVYGLRAVRYIDERVTSATTAQLLSNNILTTKSSPEVRLNFELTDSNISALGFDIEKINVGDILNIRNVKNSSGSSLWDVMIWDEDYWDYNIRQLSTMYLQVIRKEYNPTGLKIFCSSTPPDVNKRIEDIKRNLDATLTANNPDTPQ